MRTLDAAVLVGALLFACGYLCDKVTRRNLLFVVVIVGTRPAYGFQIFSILDANTSVLASSLDAHAGCCDACRCTLAWLRYLCDEVN